MMCVMCANQNFYLPLSFGAALICNFKASFYSSVCLHASISINFTIMTMIEE